MATITKRGNSFRATVSLYRKGEYKRETKTFSNKKGAELWALVPSNRLTIYGRD